MDNRVILVQSTGRKAFDLAFELLFEKTPGGKTSHYFENPKKGLVFLWSQDTNFVCHKLPIPLAWKQAADLAWEWLENQPEEKYIDYCDLDGSLGKGFKVYNESWGYVDGSHYGILGVVPMWAWYGK